MKHLIYFLCITAVCAVSCTNDKARLGNLIEEWQGREIVLPDTMVDALTGDTINVHDYDFLILSYIDSEECTSCRLKWPIWQKVLKYLDSIEGVSYELLTIVRPKDSIEMCSLFKDEYYTRKVFFDKDGIVKRTNQILDNKLFQTMLLDKTQRIVALGDPTKKNNVAKLYHRLMGDRRLQCIVPPIKIPFGQSIDVACVQLATAITHRFTLVNDGCSQLKISDVLLSCECITAVVSDSIVAPDDSVFIDVKFKEDSIEGEFYRAIKVLYENTDNFTELELSGKVV